MAGCKTVQESCGTGSTQEWFVLEEQPHSNILDLTEQLLLNMEAPNFQVGHNQHESEPLVFKFARAETTML